MNNNERALALEFMHVSDGNILYEFEDMLDEIALLREFERSSALLSDKLQYLVRIREEILRRMRYGNPEHDTD